MTDNTAATCVLPKSITQKHSSYGRIQELREFYCSEFGHEPKFYVRVPGRVNIIGEHVDYCGYPVIPMAIDQCILLAVGISENDMQLDLRNMEKEKYENFQTDINEFNINPKTSGAPAWYNYFLCGVKGIFETLNETQPRLGMTVAISGNIPPASGVSSSSALVSSAVLATAYVHQLSLDRKQLASVSASCERYIGTQGGGMDQAIAYLAKEGCAQFIEFHPTLKATPLQLPKGACFVVANSLTEMNKAATSDFNQRVVECRLGSCLIAYSLKLSNWRDMRVLVKLQEALSCSLDQMAVYAQQYVCKDLYTRSELCKIFGLSTEEFEKEFLTANTKNMETFKLQQRILHVVNESLRVEDFRRTCDLLTTKDDHHSKDKANTNESWVLHKLAILMRQSHESLKTLYECSHPNLEKLLAISDECHVSARLTGAGWGGCIVALCTSSEIMREYMITLKEKYYDNIQHKEKCASKNFDNIVFATCPRDGAEILELSID